MTISKSADDARLGGAADTPDSCHVNSSMTAKLTSPGAFFVHLVQGFYSLALY